MRAGIVGLFLLFCTLMSCKKEYNSEISSIKYIKEKYILINNPKLLVSDSRYYMLANNRYPIEEIIKYDSLGKAMEVFKSGYQKVLLYTKEKI